MNDTPRGPIEPTPDPNESPWMSHLREHHRHLFWVARSILWRWESDGSWPTRARLYGTVLHRYENSAAMEAALEELHQAAVLRAEGVMVCDAPGAEVCGKAVYRFVIRNRRGRPTVRYGFAPYLDVLSRNRGYIDPKEVGLGVLEPKPLPDALVAAYAEKFAESRELKAELER